MRHRFNTEIALLAVVLSGCSAPEEDRRTTSNDPLLQAIEKEVAAEHSNIDLQGYARFYWRESGDYVNGRYIEATGVYSSYLGRAGEAYWVEPSEVPYIDDGGCMVFNVRYHVPSEALVDASCNFEA
ncbi:hypothetical protein [Sphingomicrobium arenosum]|uniref:hypothetical protein n=1 Tax=Sphingomicrobium arenosum TaxID=2233861 RepID=UPI00223EF6C7|nr:hypothetical protein [Sphingomicrobium arenosum]